MKRNFLFSILGICAITVIMAACGKDPSSDDISGGGAISGDAVRGKVMTDSSASGDAINGIVASTSAVSGFSVQAEEIKSESYGGTLGKIENKNFRYANDRNIYEGDCDQGIYQYDLNGKKEHYYNIREVTGEYIYPEVLWVDNECIFVSCHIEQEYYEIWRIPVSKTESKKRLQVDKWEKLAEADRLDCLITKTAQEIFYCADEKIYRLNLETKETQELATGIGKYDCHIVRDSNGIPLVQDGIAYIQNDRKGKMQQLDLAKWELRDFGLSPQGNIGTDGTHFYYMTEDGMMKYNRKTGEMKTLFTGEELKDQITGTKFLKTNSITVSRDEMVNSSYVTSVFYYQNRLYVVMEAVCNVKGKIGDEYDAGDYVRFLYSCSASDGTGLRYEKEATEYLWEHSASFQDTDGEETYWTEKTGKFLYEMDGCILMVFYRKDLKDGSYRTEELLGFALYDLDRGTFSKVQKNTKKYGEMKALGYAFYEEIS